MPKTTFNDREFPAELMVTEGVDAFSERGRGMMFVEMIADVASDLAAPGNDRYDETLAWVMDSSNLESWVQIVDASVMVVPVLQAAFLERPSELKVACEYLSRSASRTGGGLDRFMRAMGMDIIGQGSSLDAWDEHGDVLELAGYSNF